MAEAKETWRTFLLAKVEERRRRRKVSLRSLAAKAGLQSPGYVQRLLDGSRNLSVETARRLGEALALGPADLAHFLDLVSLSRTADADVTNLIEARMRTRAFDAASRDLTADQASLFHRWYTPIVWTLAPMAPRARLAARLAHLLGPLVTATEVEKCMDALVASGFLQVTDKGTCVHDDALLSISTPVSSQTLGRFYLASLTAFRKLLPRLDPAHRNVRVTTFSVPASKVEAIREKIRAFHKELASMAQEAEAGGEPTSAAQVVTAALFLGLDEPA